MNAGVKARFFAVLLLFAALLSAGIAVAQSEGDDSAADASAGQTDGAVTGTEAESPGVGGLAQSADSFNVPAAATPEQQQERVFDLAMSVNLRVDNTHADRLDAQTLDGTPLILRNLAYLPEELRARAHKPGPERFQPRISRSQSMRQGQDVIIEVPLDAEGGAIRVFDDYSVVIADSKEVELFQGYLALSASEELMLVGTDPDGNRLAFIRQYGIGLSTEGDVVLFNGAHLYFYDYDEDGNLLSLTDSDGEIYVVEFDAAGSITITDADGNTGEFYDDGTYVVYDEFGDILDEGELYGENDDDTELFLDDVGDDAGEVTDGDNADGDESFDDQSAEGGGEGG